MIDMWKAILTRINIVVSYDWGQYSMVKADVHSPLVRESEHTGEIYEPPPLAFKPQEAIIYAIYFRPLCVALGP
eukprot:1641645-Pyramimonas_sp.AAC.2